MRRSQEFTIVIAVCCAGIVGTVIQQRTAKAGKSEFSRDIPPACSPQNPFAYPLDSLSKVDTSEIGYRQADSIVLPMDNPRVLCLDDRDRFHIAANNRIYRLEESGTVDTLFSAPGAIHDIAIDPDGRIYAATRNHVTRSSQDGLLPVVWTVGEEKTYLTSIAVGEGYIYLADAGMRLVWLLDTAGTVVNRIGEKDTTRDIPGFVVPSPYMDCVIGQDGSLWVVNPGRHRIENYRTNGDLVFSWGKPGTMSEGFCGCCNPVYMTIMADGSFVTAEKGIVRVKVYGPTGDFRSVVAPPSAFGRDPNGLALATDSRGRILVLDMQARLIRVFEKKPEVSSDAAT